MSVEIAWKQNILVTDFHLLKSLLVVLGFGSQAFVCGFSRQNINSVWHSLSHRLSFSLGSINDTVSSSLYGEVTFKYVHHKMGIIKATSPTASHFPSVLWVKILFEDINFWVNFWGVFRILENSNLRERWKQVPEILERWKQVSEILERMWKQFPEILEKLSL